MKSYRDHVLLTDGFPIERFARNPNDLVQVISASGRDAFGRNDTEYGASCLKDVDIRS